MSTPDPVAWLWEHPTANNGKPDRQVHFRSDKGAHVTVLGWTVTPLYAAPKPPDEDFARLFAEMEAEHPEAMAEARAWAKAELPGVLANANISDVWIVEPKRDPLTEAQIVSAARGENFRIVTLDETAVLMRIARAIEAAHGIGAKT